MQVLFYYNKVGTPDLKGEYRKKKTILHMKYTNKEYFNFGVVLVEDKGVYLPPFEYAQKKVMLHQEWKKLKDKEIK